MLSVQCRLLSHLALLSMLAAGPLAAAPLAVSPLPLTAELDGLGPGGLAVAGHPAGGWLLVGTDGETSMRFRAVRIAPDGTPVSRATTEVLDPIEVIVRALAVAPSGRWLGVWTGEHLDFVHERFQAGVFEADGTLVRELDLVVPDEKFPAEMRWAVAEATSGGEFLLAWGARTNETEPADDTLFVADLFLARFTAGGERIGGPVRVNPVQEGHQQPTDIAVGPTAVVVSWSSWCCAPSPSWEVRARVLAPDLSPRSPVIQPDDDDTESLHQTGRVLSVDAQGRFVLAWHDERPAAGGGSSPVTLFRRFDSDGTPAGAEVVVVNRHAQVAPATVNASAWLAWVDASGEVVARPFTLDGTPIDAQRGTGIEVQSPAERFGLAADPAGRLLVAVDRWPEPSQIAVLVGNAPPPERALTSPELPGFRVWVLITGQGGDSRWGAEEPACIPEALCASGAVPGRPEVLVRVVGPKPNGFLWPTLVKLTTSRVEVWIEQEASGELRHYLLPGASPGDDTLPGLFDRFGFEPR